MAAEENRVVSWYELPFCKALSEQAMFMGAPREVVILNFIIAAIFIFDFGFLPIIIFNLIIHYGAIRLCKDDAQFFECLMLYMRQKKYYTP